MQGKIIAECSPWNSHSQKEQKLVFKTDYRLFQVKSITELEHSAILSTFIKLPFVIKIFVLYIFEWPFYTGFTVYHTVHRTIQPAFVYSLLNQLMLALV